MLHWLRVSQQELGQCAGGGAGRTGGQGSRFRGQTLQEVGCQDEAQGHIAETCKGRPVSTPMKCTSTIRQSIGDPLEGVAFLFVPDLHNTEPGGLTKWEARHVGLQNKDLRSVI